MVLKIFEVNDKEIVGEIDGYSPSDRNPMLEARISGLHLFSTEIEVFQIKENLFSFKRLMMKRVKEQKSYPFWKMIPDNLEIEFSVCGAKCVAKKKVGNQQNVDKDFISKLEDGYVVVQGGFLKKPMRDDPERIERLLCFVDNKSKIFKEIFGIDLWISDGNLLGLVRDSGFLRSEKDVDMSYVSTQQTLRDFKEEYKEIIRRLEKEGQKISFWRKSGTIRRFPQWHDDSDPELLFDIFPAWLDPVEKKFVGQKKKYFDCSYEDFFPLSEKMLNGHAYLIPKCPEIYLEANYGPNWDRVDNLYVERKLSKEAFDAIESILLSEDELRSIHPIKKDFYLTSPKNFTDKLKKAIKKPAKKFIGFLNKSSE